MLIAVLITLLIAGALSYGQRSGRGALISRRPYNNRYSDAPAARRDHLG